MTQPRRLGPIVAALLLAVLLGTGCPQFNPATRLFTVTLNEEGRTFELYIPSSYDAATPTPLVLVFHTLGASGKDASGLTGFVDTAEKHGFIVAFPDAVNGAWRIHPEDFERPITLPGISEDIDDLAFVAAIIDGLSTYLNIDATRVYATGASNGGMMSYWLALKMPERFAAVAPVMATMQQFYPDEGPPPHPVPIYIIHGTADPVLPYEGGRFLGLPDSPISLPWLDERPDNSFMSAIDTVAYWVAQNGVEPTPTVNAVPDGDPDDGAKALIAVYDQGPVNSEVIFCSVEGGGHTWPSGPQYLPVAMIGPTCRDFDGAEAIWEFFERHPALEEE